MEALKAKLEQLEKEKQGLNPNDRDDKFILRRIENEQEEIRAKLQSMEMSANAKENARISVLERLGVEDEDLIKLNEIILDEVLQDVNHAHAETVSRLHKEYQQKLEEQEAGAEEREEQLRRQNSELQEHNKELLEQNKKLQEEIDKLKAEKEELSSEVEKLSKQKTELSYKINDLQAEVNDALSKRDAAVQEIERLKEELAQKSKISEIKVEVDESKKELVERINQKYRSKSPDELVAAFEERQRLKEANGGRAVIKALPLGGDQANAGNFRTENIAPKPENGGVPVAKQEVKSFREENETKRVHDLLTENEQANSEGEGTADQNMALEERITELEKRVASLEEWRNNQSG